MADVAHSCAVLGISFDSSRLFGEPLGDYATALRIVAERVSATNRAENERMERQAKGR